MVTGLFEWAERFLRNYTDLQAAEQYFRIRLDWSAIYRTGTKNGVAELLETKSVRG